MLYTSWSRETTPLIKSWRKWWSYKRVTTRRQEHEIHGSEPENKLSKKQITNYDKVKT